MLTPHITELAREVARLGVEVHYVFEIALSDERRAMGWPTGDLAGVHVHAVTTAAEARDAVDHFPAEAAHITQGVRSNGIVAQAQKRIMALGRQHYPIMEKIDLRGIVGKIKPLVYSLGFWAIAGRVTGLLAIGDGNADWIARRSPRSMRVFPFAYFLIGKRPDLILRAADRYRFVFVGGLIQRKRVDLLLEALAGLPGQRFELEIVGDGPERDLLEERANVNLPGQVTFVGTYGMDAAIDRIAHADCLVLPSDHDGWGAVVSEAQINGTPVICSSKCGAAGTVRASGFGAVFNAGDVVALRRCLAEMLDQGPLSAAERERLAHWAHCLTAEAGARYLLDILRLDGGDAINPPWERDGT